MDNPRVSLVAASNFKNLSIEEGVSLKDLSICIGPNCSGKSNFVGILKLLKECMAASPDEARNVTAFEEAVYELGGSRMLDNSVRRPASVDLSYHFSKTSTLPEGANLQLKLSTWSKDVRVTIGTESLSNLVPSGREPFYYYICHDREPGKGVVSVYDDPKLRRTTHFEFVEDIPTNSLCLFSLPALLEGSANPPENTPIYRVRRELLEAITRWQFYNANDMSLYEIRTSEPKIGPTDVYLSSSGHNLPLVLDNLIQQDLEFEERINNALRLILPLSRRIRPIRPGRLALTLEWWFTGVDDSFYLNEMSDGSVRMLCWATILHSPILPPLLVIDEPELGLHVSWMPVLAEWIKQAATRTQVLICTHSPDLLDQFTDCLEDVFCFSSKDKYHFSVRSLSMESLRKKLEEGWQLGDLYRVGDPILGGWPW